MGSRYGFPFSFVGSIFVPKKEEFPNMEEIVHLENKNRPSCTLLVIKKAKSLLDFTLINGGKYGSLN